MQYRNSIRVLSCYLTLLNKNSDLKIIPYFGIKWFSWNGNIIQRIVEVKFLNFT